MSRDFEKEYLELVNEEIPDLWDRIESRLSEKTALKTEKKKEKNPVIFFKRYAGPAAAVVCAVVAIPAFMFIRGMNKSASFESAADAPAQEARETTESTAQEETAEAACDAAEDIDEEAAESGIGAVEETVRELKEVYADQAAMTEAACDTAGAAETLILENITVQVTEEKKADAKEAVKGENEGENDMEGMLYAAVVVYDPSGTFSVDEQIEIYIPAVLLPVMTEGDAFEVDLIYEKEKEYPLTANQVRPKADMK